MIESTRDATKLMAQEDVKNDITSGKVTVTKVEDKPKGLTDDQLAEIKSTITGMINSARKQEGLDSHSEEVQLRITRRVDNFAKQFKVDNAIVHTQAMVLIAAAKDTRREQDKRNRIEVAELMGEVAAYLNSAIAANTERKHTLILSDSDIYQLIVGITLCKLNSIDIRDNYAGIVARIATVNPMNKWNKEFATVIAKNATGTTEGYPPTLVKDESNLNYEEVKVTVTPQTMLDFARYTLAPQTTIATPETNKAQEQKKHK